MKKNFKLVLALVLSIMMVLGSMPVLAATPTADSKGTITVNSPIMGAQYFAYQVFKMSMDDDTNPTAFGYSISKDDPFFAAVWTYTEKGTKHLILTGVTSTKLATAEGDIEFGEYTVTAAEDFKDVEGANGVQAFGVAMQTAYNAMTAEQKAAIKVYTPTYETGKTEVTKATAEAITFENLPYGYYLITNNYDDPSSRVEVELKYGTEGETDYWSVKLNKDSSTSEIETAADTYSKKLYPDLAAAEAYVAQNGAQFEKTWNDMSANEKAKVLADLQASTKADAIAKVNAAIAAAVSDDNAVDGTTKARLIFIDSTTPHGVINEKNEYEKWDVPVNPEGHADLPDIPEHDEPEGGKNIVVNDAYIQNDGTWSKPPIYANSAEYAIGDDVHYELSVNAVNFERTKGDDPASVKQIKEYIIADYQNKNMVFNPAKKLMVTIVKKDKDGNNVEVLAGPTDYTAWATNGFFFVNEENKDWEDPSGADKSIFANASMGGIVIPWVEVVDKNAAGFADLKNVTKSTVFTKGSEIAENDYNALTDAEKTKYFKANDDGKYYAKVPVAFERKAGEIKAGDKLIINGTSYDVAEGLKVTIDGIEYTIVDKYLTDSSDNKLQAKTSAGELIWETEDVYFHSLYPDDVTILVDYYMTITDTAVIDGTGNVNISQFGVDYVEEGDRDYEYSSNHTPGNTPPDEPKKPTEKKEKDDAVVYTYAVVIKKVDEDGNKLAGAEFQIKGLKKVTKKSDGWYKVAEYDHNDDKYYQEANLKTDKNGILVVDGFQTKWVLDVLETKAPDGYNRLTEAVKVKPIKTGSDATNTSSTIKYDENGEVISTTLTTTYKKDDVVIGRTEKVNNVITYYAGESTTPLADDADLTAEGAKTAKQKFEALFTSAADLLDSEKAKEAIVTQTGANIAELQVINQKGTELPATGGMGTTIFYVAGSIMVLAAAILLITKRRMGAND